MVVEDCSGRKNHQEVGRRGNLKKTHCSMKVWIFCSIQYPLRKERVSKEGAYNFLTDWPILAHIILKLDGNKH